MAKEDKKNDTKVIVVAIALTPLRYNDVRYETGEKIELSESEFEVLKEGKLVKRRVEE
jgi:hypothetical protein|nr:MAG TPA: hypothetical protein [Caudoviricetes sp.]